MHELDRNHYDSVRPLVQALAAYNVSVPALLDGINPGRVFVDNPATPRAVFMETVEGHHLAGDPASDVFITQINTYLRGNFYNDADTVTGGAIALCIDPPGWEQQLDALFHPRSPFALPRRHYLCTDLKYTDWREQLPDGFAVRRLDDDLLDNPAVTIPDHILSWINNNWRSRENYSRHGFGFCCLHEDTVASWSIADCVSGSRCEIGIQTQAAYRRRGLAAITVAATVDHAFANGFTGVGWHCDEDNIGSWKTSEKVGFHIQGEYMHYLVMRDAS